MKRRILILLAVLIPLFTLPTWSEPSKTEEIVSSIVPEYWYKGSDVRDAILQVLDIALEEQDRTSREAAEAAVKPCVEALNKERANSEFWRTATWCAGTAAVVLFLIGVIFVVFPK